MQTKSPPKVRHCYLKHKKSLILKALSINGVHGGTRTLDRTLRRRVLYPAELRRHFSCAKL